MEEFHKRFLELAEHVRNGGRVMINPFRNSRTTKHTTLCKKLVEQALREKNNANTL